MTKHITNRRIEALREQLNDRHWVLIHQLDTTRIATGTQLERLNSTSGSGARQVRRDLKFLTEHRAIARLDRRIGGRRAGSGSYVYAIDVAGQRLVDPSPQRWRSPWTPSVRTMDHDLAVTDLYVRAIEAQRAGDLELVNFAAEPASWRDYPGPGGTPLTLKPDAYLVIGVADVEVHAFIEVDRATESVPTIVSKANVYRDHWASGREQETTGVYPLVCWIVPNTKRLTTISGALERLGPPSADLHYVVTQPDAIAGLTQLGRLADREATR